MLEPGGQLLLSAPFDGHHPLYGEDPHPSGAEDGSHVRFGYSPGAALREFARGPAFASAASFVSGVVSQKLTT